MARKYDREFKVEARLGIGQGILSRWKREFRESGDSAFPGKGYLPPAEDKLRRLERECERLRRERDILKKAVAIFSKDPHRYSGS